MASTQLGAVVAPLKKAAPLLQEIHSFNAERRSPGSINTRLRLCDVERMTRWTTLKLNASPTRAADYGCKVVVFKELYVFVQLFMRPRWMKEPSRAAKLGGAERKPLGTRLPYGSVKIYVYYRYMINFRIGSSPPSKNFFPYFQDIVKFIHERRREKKKISCPFTSCKLTSCHE